MERVPISTWPPAEPLNLTPETPPLVGGSTSFWPETIPTEGVSISSWPPETIPTEGVSISSCPPETTSTEGVSISSWPPEDSEPLSVAKEKVMVTSTQGCKYQPKSKLRKTEFDGQTARIALAVWLRRNHKTLSLGIPDKISAKSKLNFAALTKDGRSFLENKLSDLEGSESVYSDSFDFYHTMATFCDLLKLNSKAQEYCVRSLELANIDPDLINNGNVKDFLSQVDRLSDSEKDSLWLYSRLQYQNKMLDKPSNLCEPNGGRGGSSATLSLSDDLTLKIDRVKAAEISVEHFQSEYCSKRRAVIICQAESPTPSPWTLNHIRSSCGDARVAVKTPSSHSTEWANLEEAESKKVSAFIDQKIRDHYLFDWSLPLNAPNLAKEFKVPKYFEDNILTATSPDALYRQSWPSLFLGPKGTKSGLHIDAFGSHFWMYLISGVKKWTFYPPRAAGDLSPSFSDSMDPTFNPSQEELDNVSCYSIELQPGELLFVPAGSPHKVENLDDTVAVSGNFVNSSNLSEFQHHLRVNALQDPRSRDLLTELSQLNLIT